MPIKGLTDRQAPTFPKIGDIRKGAKKTDPKRPGKDLTFFRYAPLEGEEEAAAQFHVIYGDEPREVNIFLPFDEIERNFEAYMERHTAGALQCRGDGAMALLWRDKDGQIQRTPKQCPAQSCDDCKETGRLKVIIPELRRLAYVTVHTTSVWDIVELTANLNALRRITGNGLKGIPLVLKRRPRMVSTPRENGKRVRQEKWLLSIEADQRWVERQLQAMEAAALPGSVEMPALPGPEAEAAEFVDLDTGEDWDDVPGQDEEKPKRTAQKPTKKSPPHPANDAERIGRNWPAQIIQTVITEKLAANSYNAAGMLNLSTLDPGDAEDVILNWARVYREARATAELKEAAAIANAWLAGEIGAKE